MKNAGMAGAVALVGIGLITIGLSNFANRAEAVPSAAANAGPGEPVIVWYGVVPEGSDNEDQYLYRAWSDGTVEVKFANPSCGSATNCSWAVVASPNEGLNAQADINFDERVDAVDLGQLLAAWGDAPRNDYPPSDCPLGLIP